MLDVDFLFLVAAEGQLETGDYLVRRGVEEQWYASEGLGRFGVKVGRGRVEINQVMMMWLVRIVRLVVSHQKELEVRIVVVTLSAAIASISSR